jgi:FHA domain
VVARLEALPGYVKLDASDVSEAVEQLIDEIVAYESRPSAHQYLEFKSAQMAVDIAQGGVHAADVKMKSAASKAILGGVQDAGGFTVTITEKGGATRVEHHDSAELTIGRVQGNEIVLPSGNISKRHTRVVLRDGKAIAVCLKSTNGTYVNGQRITAPRILGASDRVSIGDFTMTFVPVLKP